MRDLTKTGREQQRPLSDLAGPNYSPRPLEHNEAGDHELRIFKCLNFSTSESLAACGKYPLPFPFTTITALALADSTSQPAMRKWRRSSEKQELAKNIRYPKKEPEVMKLTGLRIIGSGCFRCDQMPISWSFHQLQRLRAAKRHFLVTTCCRPDTVGNAGWAGRYIHDTDGVDNVWRSGTPKKASHEAAGMIVMRLFRCLLLQLQPRSLDYTIYLFRSSLSQTAPTMPDSGKGDTADNVAQGKR